MLAFAMASYAPCVRACKCGVGASMLKADVMSAAARLMSTYTRCQHKLQSYKAICTSVTCTYQVHPAHKFMHHANSWYCYST